MSIITTEWGADGDRTAVLVSLIRTAVLPTAFPFATYMRSLKHFSFFVIFLDALADPAVPVRAHPDEIAPQGAQRRYDCAEVREERPDGGAEMAGKLRRGKPEKRRYYKEQKGAAQKIDDAQPFGGSQQQCPVPSILIEPPNVLPIPSEPLRAEVRAKAAKGIIPWLRSFTDSSSKVLISKIFIQSVLVRSHRDQRPKVRAFGLSFHPSRLSRFRRSHVLEGGGSAQRSGIGRTDPHWVEVLRLRWSEQAV
jgi:hypothetical protein